MARVSARIRQLTVTASEVACVVGTLYGTGVLGTAVEDTAGGRLSSTATLLAPAGAAFSIWSVIYTGLAAYMVFQWLPANTTASRASAVGWLAAASMLLNAAWLLVTQEGWLLASVGVILALLAVLVTLNRRLAASRARNPLESLVLDWTFGLYLGWVMVATAANIAAVAVTEGDQRPTRGAVAVAVAALLAIGFLGGALARVLGGRLSVAVATVWGLGWIAVGRLIGEPRSAVTAVAAVVAAVIVIAIVYGGILESRHRR